MIKDPVTEMAAFKAGEIDFIASFSPEHVDTLKAQVPERQDHDRQGDDADAATMKVTVPKDGKPMSKERAPHPIFGDVRVRKAVGCYGIDRTGDREDRLQGPGHAVGGHEPARARWTRWTSTTCAPTTRPRPRPCSPRPATARRSR